MDISRWTAFPRPRGVLVALAGLATGCGGGASPTGPETDPREPLELLSGPVIASNSFVVEGTDSVAGFYRISSGATLPADLGVTVGKLLVLSMRDISRPDIVCTGAMFDSNCAVLEVLESLDEGYVGVEFASGRRNFYLQSTQRLEVNPEPA